MNPDFRGRIRRIELDTAKTTNTYVIRSAVSGATFLLGTQQREYECFTTTITIRNYGWSSYYYRRVRRIIQLRHATASISLFLIITLITNILIHHNYLSQVPIYGLRKQRQSIIISKRFAPTRNNIILCVGTINDYGKRVVFANFEEKLLSVLKIVICIFIENILSFFDQFDLNSVAFL